MDHSRILLNVWRFIQILAFILVNSIVDVPYMDEIFHVRQAQEMCAGHFSSYDPKLTTPPGLYIVSYALHGLSLPCNIAYLRYVNLFTGTILLPKVCTLLYRHIHPSAGPRHVNAASLIASMPLFSFFSLLYYTDQLSTSLVLWSFYQLRKGNSWFASLVGSSAAVLISSLAFVVCGSDRLILCGSSRSLRSIQWKCFSTKQVGQLLLLRILALPSISSW